MNWFGFLMLLTGFLLGALTTGVNMLYLLRRQEREHREAIRQIAQLGPEAGYVPKKSTRTMWGN